MKVRVVPTLRCGVRRRMALTLLWMAARMVRFEMLTATWEDGGDDV